MFGQSASRSCSSGGTRIMPRETMISDETTNSAKTHMIFRSVLFFSSISFGCGSTDAAVYNTHKTPDGPLWSGGRSAPLAPPSIRFSSHPPSEPTARMDSW